MNEISAAINEELLRSQAQRLKDLIAEMLKCCEDRKIYESGRFGLPYSELKVLMLFAGERYLTVKGIAQKLEVTRSRVTKLIDGLRKRELAEQIHDPKDARIKLISLTPEGQRKAGEIGEMQQELHRKILLQMDPEQRKNMLSYLELLRSAMEDVKEGLT
jgi:DNA-binding MarR family transcriptional regulator